MWCFVVSGAGGCRGAFPGLEVVVGLVVFVLCV